MNRSMLCAARLGILLACLHAPFAARAADQFATAGNLLTSRSGHTATLLADGRVLIAGGSPSNWAEVYNPATQASVSTQNMLFTRLYASAVRLPDGRVLVVGGNGGCPGGEIYDPATNQFTATAGNLAYPIIEGSTATLLGNGKVLVLGGDGGGAGVLYRGQLYDPATGLFTLVASQMTYPRKFHTAVLLADGRVMIAGGYQAASTIEYFNPADNTFSNTGVGPGFTRYFTATLLPGGLVLMAQVGGTLLNTGTNGLSAASNSPPGGGDNRTATLLPDGRVLYTGGSVAPSGSALYAPGTTSFSAGPALSVARNWATATQLPDGRVLIAGGAAGVTNGYELFTPGAATIPAGRRPLIGSFPTRVEMPATISVSGTGFRGDSEGSSGNPASSAANYPILRLTYLADNSVRYLPADPAAPLTSTSYLTGLQTTLPFGDHSAAIIVNGVPSAEQPVRIAWKPPVITTASLPNGQVSLAYSAPALTYADGYGAVTYAALSGLPPGLTLSAGGVLSGTPTAPGGTFNLAVQVTDSLGSSTSATFTFTIYPALSITTSSLPNGTVGVAYVRAIATSGGSGGLAWSVSSGITPSGVSLGAANGQLTGTPVAAGSSIFTVRVVDSLGAAASKPFSLKIVQPLSIINSQLTRGVVGNDYPFTLLQAAGGFPQYSFQLESGVLPPGLTLNLSGQLTGRPTVAGGFPVTLRVTDSTNATATRAYTMIVSDPPAIDGWTPRGTFGGRIQQVVVSPSYPADQTVFVVSETGELFTSGDRGASWSRALVNPALAYTAYNRLVVAPTYDASQPPDGFTGTWFFASYDLGVWRTTSNGATIAAANSGIPCATGACVAGQYPHIVGLAVNPAFASAPQVWAADSGNRIFRSLDTGGSWNAAGTLPEPAGSLEILLAVSPAFAADQTVFAALNNKIYRTVDAGASWSLVYSATNSGGQAPLFKNLLLSPNYASDHTLIAESDGFKLYRSLDGGANFADISAPASAYGFHLAVVPRAAGPSRWFMESPNLGASVYRLLLSDDLAATFSAGYASGMSAGGEQSFALAASPELPGGGFDLFYGTEQGLYASFNDGFSFNSRDDGLGANVVYGVDGAAAVMAAGYKGGWFKSANAAQSRVRLGAPNDRGGVSEVYFSAVSPDYANDRVIFLGDALELLRSEDGGQTFAAVLPESASDVKIAFPPNFSGAPGAPVSEMYAGTPNGLYRSADGGRSFLAVYPPVPSCSAAANPAVQGIAYSPNFATDHALFVATAVSGADGGLCRYNALTQTWTRVTNGGSPISGPIALSPVYNQGAPSGDAGTLLIQRLRSTNGGASWSSVSGPAGMTGQPYFSPAFVTDRMVLSTGGGVFRSTDGGASFAALGTGDALNSRVVTALHLSETVNGPAGVVIAATNGSGIWRSTDGGLTFQPATKSASLPSTVNQIARVPAAAALADGASLAAAGDALLAATAEQGVFRSTDGGITFESIAAGLPADANARAVIAPTGAPAQPLAAVAGRGLWRYDGAAWSAIPGFTTGTYGGFHEDANYLYAARTDGPSARAAKDGTGWTALSAAEATLVAIDDGGGGTLTLAGDPALKRAGPVSQSPSGSTAPLWAVALAGGPRWSADSGASWTAAPGGNDYALPGGQTWRIIKALGLNATSGAREAVAGSAAGLWRTLDGGDAWRRADGPGSGLEATAKDYSAILTAPTSFGSTDLLVGITGATTGGVYLSGDGGEHWTQVNQGFDPANLSISTLVKSSCAGCPVQYYSGSYGGGLYTRTIAVVPPPQIPSVNYACWGSTSCGCTTDSGSGPISGGQPFKLCGSNFQAGLVVEFDGVPAAGCVRVDANTLACAGTPAHIAGYAGVRVRNPDTRAGSLPAAYQYAGGTSRPGNSLRVAKAGSDANLSWTCAACVAGAPARVYRAQNAGLSQYPERYDGGIAGAFTNSGALASGRSYFWAVE